MTSDDEYHLGKTRWDDLVNRPTEDGYEWQKWVYAGQRESDGAKTVHKWYDLANGTTGGTHGEFYFVGRNGGASVVGGIYALQVTRGGSGDDESVSVLFSTLEYTSEIYEDLRPAWVIKHNAAKSARTRKAAENKAAKIHEDLSDFTLGEIIQVGVSMNASQRRALMARVMQIIERGYEA